MSGESVVRREVTVRLLNGLHLRPISEIARRLADYPCSVTIMNGERSADAKSTLDLMSLQAGHGTRLVLEARGEQAEEAIDAILPFLETESIEEVVD